MEEQLVKLQQMQASLQGILAQKQQIEAERIDTDRALEELKKAHDDDLVYKHAGAILIKSTRAAMITELDERKELAATRSTVLDKQESRLRENLKEQESKVSKSIAESSSGRGSAPPQERPESQS